MDRAASGHHVPFGAEVAANHVDLGVGDADSEILVWIIGERLQRNLKFSEGFVRLRFESAVTLPQ